MRSKDLELSDIELTPDPEINVTPFIDVMLVLLIIFMVTAPMMATGMKLDLPKSSQAKPLAPVRPVVISIGPSGELQVGDDAVSDETLLASVRQALSGEVRPIQIRGDHRTPYGIVVSVMDVLAKGGIEKLVLAFERPKQGAP